MRVVLDNPAGEAADLELQLGREDATVGDLLDALPDGARARGIVLDGRFCHVDLALSEIGLYEGARIHPADGAPAGREAAPAGLELRVIAGFDAGRRLVLAPGGVVIGRDPDCDLVLADESVSRRHLRVAPSRGGLRASVTDLDSVNGTWVGGRRIRQPTDVEPEAIFEAGDVAFTIRPEAPGLPIDSVRQASLAGTIAFNRPPREHALVIEDPLSAPDEPSTTSRPRFSWASAFGPLVLGAVMVIVLKNILFALFMLLSPVLVIGSWLEQRRTAKQTSRGGQREFEQQLETFRRQVGRRQTAELARRRDAFPDLAEISRRAIAPDPRLWERRSEHDDFLRLSAGYGEIPFRPALAAHSGLAQAAEVVLAEHGWLQLAPVAVDLDAGGVVGIVGDREQALALARALVCQAAVLHGPADLMVAVFTEQPARQDWDWVKWLPHARDAAGASGRLLAVGPAAGTAPAS
jgi:S-DNA-T family DNA segregation ATPase FtsK/SpoIIIE